MSYDYSPIERSIRAFSAVRNLRPKRRSAKMRRTYGIANARSHTWLRLNGGFHSFCASVVLTAIDCTSAEAEAIAWVDADRFYDARLSELVDLGQPERSSAKAKGKQRAALQDLDSVLPHADDMPNGHRGGLDVALKVLADETSDSVSKRLTDLHFEVR
jgi:hypothetical protein